MNSKDVINYIVNNIHLIDEIHVISDIEIYDKWVFANIQYTDINNKLVDTIIKIYKPKIEKFLKNISHI